MWRTVRSASAGSRSSRCSLPPLTVPGIAGLLLEARTVGRLSHANIVTPFDAGEHNGLPDPVFEDMPTETLTQAFAHTAAASGFSTLLGRAALPGLLMAGSRRLQVFHACADMVPDAPAQQPWGGYGGCTVPA